MKKKSTCEPEMYQKNIAKCVQKAWANKLQKNGVKLWGKNNAKKVGKVQKKLRYFVIHNPPASRMANGQKEKGGMGVAVGHHPKWHPAKGGGRGEGGVAIGCHPARGGGNHHRPGPTKTAREKNAGKKLQSLYKETDNEIFDSAKDCTGRGEELWENYQVPPSKRKKQTLASEAK